jgi:AraC-like DNA-binding protein
MRVIQPARTPDWFLKSYDYKCQAEDKAAWQAIVRNTVVRGSDLWSGNSIEDSEYYQNCLQPTRIRYIAAAPLTAPLFAGYPGALYVCRTSDQGDFSNAELDVLARSARSADEILARQLENRTDKAAMEQEFWAHRAPIRYWIFNASGEQVLPKGDSGLESHLEQELRKKAKFVIDQGKKKNFEADRILVPDEWGDLWVFRGVYYPSFPVIGSGAHALFTLQPQPEEWVSVRPSDVAADPELVRLLPSMRFMHQDFAKCPGLGEIARKAHLSPFHFHRRFSMLVGQTPKHFMMSSQIKQAKRMLLARKRELAVLATDCGFAHQSHFTSRFKQTTGLTPTRWRRMIEQLHPRRPR